MSLPIIQYPTFTFEIPSTKKKVKIRPFLVKEEKILLIAKTTGVYADMLAAIKQVVTACLLDTIDVNKLAIFDLEYLFLKLRAVSVNNISKVSYKDSEDEKQYDFDIDLDKVEVKFPENANKVIAINEEYSLLMKYPEASMYTDKDFNSTDVVENLNFFVINTIDKIVQGDKVIDFSLASKEVVNEFIDNLPVKAYEQIKEFWNTIPKLFHEIKYKNSKGNERTIKLETLTDFFTL